MASSPRSVLVGMTAGISLAVTLAASPARAQSEPAAADIITARALGQEGVWLADNGRCREALDRLKRAEALFHAPSTLARLGECQVELLKLVAGTENLNRVVRETLPSNAPSVFREAQERARKVLAEARPRIATLRIGVTNATGEGSVVVKIDGEIVPVAGLGTNRPADPGEHVVEVSAPGYKVATARVSLAEGASETVTLTMVADATPAPVPSSAPGAEVTSPRPRSRAPAYVALGLGLAGLGVGGVFGALALGKKDELEGLCASKQCPEAEARSVIESGRRSATVSTVGFAAGIVGVALGSVLLIAAPSGGAASATAGASPLRVRLLGASVEPALDPRRVGLVGTF